jgi:DNA-directed RNA polymerase specialized sigma24 family protein
MNGHFQRKEEQRTKALDYALPADFCGVFETHVDSLYTLSLLLTADHDKADECVIAGLEDCLQGNPVFREWVQSWARRMVIKNAIRMISPARLQPETATGNLGQFSDADTAVAAITSLQPFERFVYVLSVLEKYPDRECATLLDCTPGQVIEARTQALRQVVSVGDRRAAETAPPRVGAQLKQLYGEVL